MTLEDIFEDINDGRNIAPNTLERWAMKKLKSYNGGELTLSEIT